LLFGRGAARASVIQNENIRSVHELRERETETETDIQKDSKKRYHALCIFFSFFFFSAGLAKKRGMMMMMIAFSRTRFGRGGTSSSPSSVVDSVAPLERRTTEREREREREKKREKERERERKFVPLYVCVLRARARVSKSLDAVCVCTRALYEMKEANETKNEKTKEAFALFCD